MTRPILRHTIYSGEAELPSGEYLLTFEQMDPAQLPPAEIRYESATDDLQEVTQP